MTTNTTTNTNMLNDNDDSGIVVLPGNVGETGVVSYWKLPPLLQLSALAQAWADHGLDATLLPSPPTEELALSRAVATLKHTTTTATSGKKGKKSLRRNVELLARGDWAIVTPVVTTNRVRPLDFKQEVRVTLGASSSRYPFVVAAIDADAWETDEFRAQIEAAYDLARADLTSTDVSRWLKKLAMGPGGVCLRDAGGVYFVPREHSAFWRTVDRALRAATDVKGKIYKLPAMLSDEVVEVVLDALVEEAEAEAASVEADLAAEGEAAPSGCVLRNRGAKCTAVLNKVASYESLLGQALPVLTDRLEKLRANAVAAAFLADARDDAAKAKGQG